MFVSSRVQLTLSIRLNFVWFVKLLMQCCSWLVLWLDKSVSGLCSSWSNCDEFIWISWYEILQYSNLFMLTPTHASSQGQKYGFSFTFTLTFEFITFEKEPECGIYQIFTKFTSYARRNKRLIFVTDCYGLENFLNSLGLISTFNAVDLSKRWENLNNIERAVILFLALNSAAACAICALLALNSWPTLWTVANLDLW